MIERLKNTDRKYKLQFGLIAVNALLAITLTVAIVFVDFRLSARATERMVDKLFNEISDETLERTNYIITSAVNLARSSAKLTLMETPPGEIGIGHPSIPYMIESLKAAPHISSLYTGFKTGEFMQLIALRGNKELQAIYKAPKLTAFVLRLITREDEETRQQSWTFLDDDGFLIGSHTDDAAATYNPDQRPWFSLAMSAKGSHFTAPYVFSSSKKPGITVAQTLPNGSGVLGVDIMLASLSDFTRQQDVSENGLVFIFDSQERMLAHPSVEAVIRQSDDQKSGVKLQKLADSTDPLLQAIQQTYKTKIDTTTALKIAGSQYMTRLSQLDSVEGFTPIVAVIAPYGDFTSHLNEMRLLSISSALGLLVIAVVILAFISRQMSKSLTLLARDAERIQSFDLTGQVDGKSVIMEVRALQEAFNSMKKGLQTFGLYMPRSVVEKLIQSDITPVIGGQKQELTILFSDVHGFTSISEQLTPEELLVHTSLYFEVLREEIGKTGGVVDKFVGDAIMAFWNAPNIDEDHTLHGCMSLLLCREANRRFNEDFADQKYPPYLTRFGLHTGEAIVGNVGASDRMSYTAFGPTINLAARLEDLNRLYQTELLVSESVYHQVKHEFVLRKVDTVIPKGMTAPHAIYELLGLKQGSTLLPEAYQVTEEQNNQVLLWEQAYALYEAQKWEEAAAFFEDMMHHFEEDALCKIYTDRSRLFAQNPPPSDWNGVL